MTVEGFVTTVIAAGVVTVKVFVVTKGWSVVLHAPVAVMVICCEAPLGREMPGSGFCVRVTLEQLWSTVTKP